MTTQTKFDHKMTRQALDMRFTKSELYEMLRDQTSARVTRSMSKDDLVDMAWAKVSVMRAAVELEEQEAASMRAAQLEADYANDGYKRALGALLHGLEKVAASCKIKNDEFNERVTKYSLADAIEWRGTDVFITAEVQGLVEGLRAYVLRTRNAELPENKRTMAEFVRDVNNMITSKTNWLLESNEYKSNSTSPMANVRSQCKFRAEQQFLKLLKDVLQAFQHDSIGEMDNIACYGNCLHVYIG